MIPKTKESKHDTYTIGLCYSREKVPKASRGWFIMKVKCVICDQIENIDDNSFQAKRLRNRRLNMYLCKTCNNRIELKTKARHKTGKFRLFKDHNEKNNFI